MYENGPFLWINENYPPKCLLKYHFLVDIFSVPGSDVNFGLAEDTNCTSEVVMMNLDMVGAYFLLAKKGFIPNAGYSISN